jgi:hypothetical protein
LHQGPLKVTATAVHDASFVLVFDPCCLALPGRRTHQLLSPPERCASNFFLQPLVFTRDII